MPNQTVSSPFVLAPDAGVAGRLRLPRRASFYLLASIIVFFLAGSSAPTPLYAVYQAAWGFSPITTTVVFGIYALTVLANLLVFGALSDHVGRRPVLLVATLLQAVAMAVFATAHGVGALLAARVIQGISTGAAAGAIGAGMLDIDRQKGTVANAVGPTLGTATGGIVSGLMVQYLPAPTQLVYVLFGAIFLVQALGVLAMRESATPRPGAIASLRPQLRVPAHLRKAVLLATPALVSAWSLAGFYGSLGPALVRRLAGSTSVALGGLALFVLAASATVSVLATRTRPPHTVMALGTAALVAGVGISVVAIEDTSLATFFVGTAIAGAGFGGAFQGAIRSVLLAADADERAGVLSVLYIVAYLSMGLPAILAGVRAVHGGGVMTTAKEYGFAVMSIAAMALAGTLIERRARAEAAVASPAAAGEAASVVR
jgi:MFS family permease